MTSNAALAPPVHTIYVRYRRAITLSGLVVAVAIGFGLLSLAGEREDTPVWISIIYPLFYFSAGVRCRHWKPRLPLAISLQ